MFCLYKNILVLQSGVKFRVGIGVREWVLVLSGGKGMDNMKYYFDHYDKQAECQVLSLSLSLSLSLLCYGMSGYAYYIQYIS